MRWATVTGAGGGGGLRLWGARGGPAPQIVGIAVGLVFTERVVVPMVYRLKLTSINEVGDGHRGGRGGGGVKAVGGKGGPAPQIVGIAVGLVFTERVVVPMVYRLKLTSINEVGDGHRGGGGVKAGGGRGVLPHILSVWRSGWSSPSVWWCRWSTD